MVTLIQYPENNENDYIDKLATKYNKYERKKGKGYKLHRYSDEQKTHCLKKDFYALQRIFQLLVII